MTPELSLSTQPALIGGLLCGGHTVPGTFDEKMTEAVFLPQGSSQASQEANSWTCRYNSTAQSSQSVLRASGIPEGIKKGCAEEVT